MMDFIMCIPRLPVIKPIREEEVEGECEHTHDDVGHKATNDAVGNGVEQRPVEWWWWGCAWGVVVVECEGVVEGG